MWRAEVLLQTMYRSATSSFDKQLVELLQTPECSHALRMMERYLQQFVNVPVPDVRCDNRLDELYTSLRGSPDIRNCLQKLPLEWQLVMITHLQSSCAFNAQKGVKGAPDVEYVLPSTRKLVEDFFSDSYWREMMELCIQYAYAPEWSKLPEVGADLPKMPTIKGSEAVLRRAGGDPSNKRGRADDTFERERVCLMHNLNPVSAFDVPTLTLTEPLRVFSDQQLPDISANFPQPILQTLIDGVDTFDLCWKCGFIWTHTYPLWNWKNGAVRLDITVPKDTVVLYTRFSELYMFTPLFDASRHMTLLLKPGKLVVTKRQRVPRPLQHGSEDDGRALAKEQFLTVIKCEYLPDEGDEDDEDDEEHMQTPPKAQRV